MLLPYTINFTDDADKPSFQIQPGQIDTTTTTLDLPGKGRVDYGEVYNENLVKMLEHFSSASEPSMKTKGQLWYDSFNKQLKVYDPTVSSNGGWLIIMTTGVLDRFHVPVVSTLPTLNLIKGDLTFLSTDNKLYVYDGSAWRALATQLWAETALVIDGGTWPVA